MREITNYPNYFITETGVVYSQKRGRGLNILKANNQTYGYPAVGLYKNNEKPKTKCIHRLVSEAFIPNPDNKPSINHKDGNKENNVIANLEWVTHQENMLHALLVLGLKCGGPMNAARPVTATSIRTGETTSHISVRGAVRNLALPPHMHIHVAQVCKGQRDQAGGYTWEYIDEN